MVAFEKYFVKKKRTLVFLSIFFLFTGAKADEGMWMLPYIEQLNIQKMNGMGCSLSAEDIYSDKNISLKDAVIVFGNGCTGVVVSPQGLIFTNHHCGFDAIQQHSSVEHNYLKDGFNAVRLEDEIPTPGLSVKFLVKIEDVTNQVLSHLPDSLSEKSRNEKIYEISDSICKAAEKDTHYLAEVKPFFAGNEFYLLVYEEFKDVRLAFAPPSSIGNFGGDTDNWMWPRHTGDFSVFRVYATPDGKPAEYSKDNVPYSPKRFASVSNKGYQTNDFTMILGNPGSTSRYLTSFGVKFRMETGNQARIDVRGIKQTIWRSFMRKDEAINIAYANKYASSSNYWKNSIGMNKAIQKLNVLERKREQEAAFLEWTKSNPEREKKYKDVLKTLEDGYSTLYPYARALNYLRESLMSGVELPRIAQKASQLISQNLPKDSLIKELEEIYKDYRPEVDQAVFAAMLDVYKNSVDADALPAFYQEIQKKFKGNTALYAASIFQNSAFSSVDKLKKNLQKKKIKIANDPALIFGNEVRNTYEQISSGIYAQTSEKVKEAERIYFSGLREMYEEQGKKLYPDANFTMRMTYGKIGGYQPADAVDYHYYTTTKGILEKENPTDPEFIVPDKLKKSILEKDFGKYLDPQTKDMHVNFISNNDITGGNSGSPVFNGKGELIGLAFDGNWEAMSGDIVFEPELQRTISVDIRYVLYVMDKIGGAQRLIDELSISGY
ncbi:MAG TPA: S46 family peptidase [Paludibacteraceae bacterium]|jgi:hypothetical protein|nr:S46 family peptidase [Paludibacteraceae bacterium]